MPAEGRSGSVVACLGCRDEMGPEETGVFGPDGPAWELYVCPACARKAILVFEPAGGLTDEERSWVEREVAAHGSFFPADYTGGTLRRRR